MRSSKSRSRSKNNRNRSVGNVVNRVFDSSGPEGKVRGTPQQIIDKYNQLARDAQLSNDRVATENFQQHAEHYLRMLAEAQREQAERQAQQQANQERQQQQRNNNNGGGGQPQGGEQPQAAQQGEGDRQPAQNEAQQRPPEPQAQAPADDVMDVTASDNDSPLVETPENRQPRQRKPRKKPEPQPQAEVTDQPTPDAAE
ncbi:MAG: DUF4167 domain-containing protein [Paracoccaceae bacterium]